MIDNDEYNDIYTGDPKNNPLDTYLEGYTYSNFIADNKRLWESGRPGFENAKKYEKWNAYAHWVYSFISDIEEPEAAKILNEITTAAFIEYGKHNDTNKWPHYNIRRYIGLCKREELILNIFIPNREIFYKEIFGKPAKEGIAYVLMTIEDTAKYLDNTEKARAIISETVKKEYPGITQTVKEWNEATRWYFELVGTKPKAVDDDSEDFLTYMGDYTISVLMDGNEGKEEYTETEIIQTFKEFVDFVYDDLEDHKRLRKAYERLAELKKQYGPIIDFINEVFPPTYKGKGGDLYHNVSVCSIMEKIINEGIPPGYNATKEDLEHWKELIREQIIHDYGSIEYYEKITSLSGTLEETPAPKKKERRRKAASKSLPIGYLTTGIDPGSRALSDNHVFKEETKDTHKVGFIPPLEHFLIASEKRTFSSKDDLTLTYNIVMEPDGTRRKISEGTRDLLGFINSKLKRNTPKNEHIEGSPMYSLLGISDYKLITEWMGEDVNITKLREPVHKMLMDASNCWYEVDVTEVLEKNKERAEEFKQWKKGGRGYKKLLVFDFDEDPSEEGRYTYYFQRQPANEYIADILHQTVSINAGLTHIPRLNIEKLQEEGARLQRRPPSKIGEEDGGGPYKFKSKEETDRAIKIIKKYAEKYDLWSTGKDTNSVYITSSVKNKGIMGWVSKEIALRRRHYCAGGDGEIILKASEIYEKLWDQTEARKNAGVKEEEGPSKKEKETLVKTVERFLIYLMIAEEETGVYDFKEQRKGRGRTPPLEAIIVKVRKQPNPQRLQ